MAEVEATEQAGPPPAGGKPRWTRLAVLGLVMVGIAPLLMVAAALIWGMDVSEEIGFFLVLGAVPLVAAFLVARFGLWAKVVGAVIALAAAFMMFWTAFGLLYPQSVFDFVPGLLVIPGGIIALVSCIGAIVAERRGHLGTEPVGGEQRALRIVPAVVIALAVISAAVTLAGRSTVDAAQADTTVVLKDFEFDQEEYAFAPGTTLLVKNEDAFVHTFTVEAWDVDETLGPGAEALVEVPNMPGEYVLFCRPHTSDTDAPTEDDMAARISIR